ncbi:ABC transporter ATP-binding protein [Castellaniella sp.]|uniref:ABC transporter ATP-binding protein n=1 Tax=Castellaniella sp. TaxID=1955812 RepID=UPI002AFF95A6|nr:ABC transporter ATP-binding protein [Castellaniella sp.]
MAAAYLVQDVHKHFRKDDQELVALRGANLTVEAGSFLVLLGRSGCGKSTLLNLMAGLATPTAGTLTYRGRAIAGPLGAVGYLTQQDTLMPWRTVLRNIEMPLEIQGVAPQARATAAQRLIDQVGLSGFERHYPRELSGGMRRRVSLARMLCGNPETLLLDEPFGALDAQLRGDLQQQLLELWADSGRTVVFVTHDIEEALMLADRVVVLGPLGAIMLDTTIDLPRPRDADEIRLHPDYLNLYRALTRALRQANP